MPFFVLLRICLAMSAQAIAQRTSVMRKTVSDNELFTFRVWLVRMGLNGYCSDYVIQKPI